MQTFLEGISKLTLTLVVLRESMIVMYVNVMIGNELVVPVLVALFFHLFPSGFPIVIF